MRVGTPAQAAPAHNGIYRQETSGARRPGLTLRLHHCHTVTKICRASGFLTPVCRRSTTVAAAPRPHLMPLAPHELALCCRGDTAQSTPEGAAPQQQRHHMTDVADAKHAGWGRNDEKPDMRRDFCFPLDQCHSRWGSCHHRRGAVGSNGYCLATWKKPPCRVRNGRRVGSGPAAACDASHR